MVFTLQAMDLMAIWTILFIIILLWINLKNMPYDHPYIHLYNLKKSVICVGKGAWEIPSSTGQLDDILREKNINTWVDYWGL